MNITINSLTVELSELDVKLLRVLIAQTGSKLTLADDPLDIEGLVMLIESRIIYSSMFGYQYQEEKEMLPRLKVLFKALKSVNKLPKNIP